MVFGLLAGLLSIVSSALVFVVGAVIFSKTKEQLITFFVAVTALLILIAIIRLFFPKHHNMRNMAMQYRMHGGHSRFGFRRFFNHEQQRQIINGSVARIIAFGFILYTFTPTMLYVYIALGLAFVTGIIAMLAHRSKPVDVVIGAIFGFGVGYLAIKYTPLLMKLIGF
jgi:hypothetical protein